MPCCTFPVDPVYGPVLDIGIAAPLSLTPAGAPLPSINWIKAIADTGSSHTSIATVAAGRIGLPIINQTTVGSTTQLVPANIYLADLFLRWNDRGQTLEFAFRDRPMTELVRATPANEALLGMDMLEFGTFSLNGENKTATFCW
jgi:hypothetical protein